MAGGTIYCSAAVSTSSTGAPQCLSAGAAVAWTFVPDFDFTQLDAPTAAGAFSAGYVMIGIAWAIGKGFGLVLSMFR